MKLERLWSRNYVILLLCAFLLFLDNIMLISTLPTYVQNEFAANSVTISMMTSAFALSAIVARMLAGKVLKRGNPRKLVFAGILLIFLSAVGTYWGYTVGQLAMMRILFGFGFGICSTVYPTCVSQSIPRERLGEGVGYYGLSSSVALAAGPLFGLMLLERGSMESVVVTVFLMTIAMFPLASAIPTNAGPTAGTAQMTSRPAASKWISCSMLMPGLLNFLLSVTYGGVITFLALLGREMKLDHAGQFFLFHALAAVLVRPVAGKLFDRKGPAPVSIPAACLVGVGLLLLSYAGSMPLLAAAALLYGSGFGMLQPSLQAWIVKEAAPELRGVANGLFMNSLDLGVALGSLLLGAIAARTGYALMFRFSSLFIVLLLVIYTVYLLKKARQNRAEQTANMD